MEEIMQDKQPVNSESKPLVSDIEDPTYRMQIWFAQAVHIGVLLLSSVFAIYAYQANILVNVFFMVALALAAAAALVYYTKTRFLPRFFKSAMYLAGIGLAFESFQRGSGPGALMWAFIFPGIAYYLGGLRHGTYVSWGFWLVVAVALISRNIPADIRSFPFHQFSALLSLAVVTGVTWAVSFSAQSYKRKLNVLQHQLSVLERTDAQTGLASASEIRIRIEQEAARFDRFRRPFCLMVCDLDQYASISAKYGEQFANVAIIEVADLLRRMLREQDIAARWGTTGFMLVLTETPLEKAVLVGERLRKAVGELSLVHKGVALTQTLSVGLVMYEGESGVDACIAKVEARREKATTVGGNRVVSGDDFWLYTRFSQ